MQIDFGLTAGDYARHRAGFPDSFFERLVRWHIGLSGQQIVDVGTGTGTLARGFACRGCRVIGIDPSGSMLAQARRLDDGAGVRVTYRAGQAERTGLEAESADVVTAGQCWHWFDRPAAAEEAARVLRSTGFIVIAHLDWLPLTGNVVAATEDLILRHNPAWQMANGNGLYPQWLRDLDEAGYRDIESFSNDVDVPYTHEDWRGRIRASAGVAASLSASEVEAFDAELQDVLYSRYPAPVLSVPHRISAVIARPPQP